MKQISANITGSLILNGVDITTTVQSSSIWSGSFSTRITDLELFSSSLDNTYATDAQLTSVSQSFSSSVSILSGSLQQRVTNTEVTSSNLTTASGSFSIRVTNNEATASSLVNASSSFSTRVTTNETNISNLQTASGSFSTRTTNLETASGSFSTRVTSNESNISALQTASGSFSTRITNAESSITSLNSKTGSYATTGSNIFVDSQYISAANNALGFASTASLYTDGGMRVTKDAYVSGTLYLNNLTVYGTSSIQYVTSSQLNVATNIITVNTNTPSVRFGGITVYDSGSLGHTGSLFWDSQNDKWIYSNPSGSNYDGGMLISGPRNSSGLGNEVGTTACALMMGQGGDHITSSAIFHYGNATCFYGNSHISSSGNICTSTATFTGCVGIGTTTPTQKLTVAGNILLSGSSTSLNFNTTSQGNGDISFDGNAFAIVSNSNVACLLLSTSSTPRLQITNTGVACFSCQVCTPSIIACNAFLQVPSTAAVVDILRLNNPAVASSGTRIKFENGYGDLAAIRVTHRDNGALADDGQIEFQVGSNTVLDTKMTILNTGQVGIGTTSPDVFGRGDGFDVGISSAGVSSTQNMSLQLNAGATAGRGAQIYMGQGGTRHFTISSNVTESSIGTTSNTPLRFVTCDSLERFRITAAGIACFACQVCAPAAIIGGQISVNAGNGNQLYLNNSGQRYTQITFDNNSSGATKGGLWWDNTTCFFEMYSSFTGGLRFYTSGDLSNPRLTITSGGIACFACQICSTTISATTEFRLGASFSRVAIIDPGSGAFSGGYNYNFNSGTPQHDSTGALSAYYYDSGGAIRFFTNSSQVAGTGACERFRITSAGRVGIGDSSPVSALVVSTPSDTSSIGQSGIVIQGSSTLTAGCVMALAFTAIPGTSRARAAVGSVVGSDWGKGNLAFYTRDASDATSLSTADERMRITSGGCVGIGTITPYSRLTISGALSTGTSQISILNTEGGHYIIRTGIAGIQNQGLSIISADADGSNQNTRIAIASSGNVGIGTTSPTAPLTIRCDSSSTASSIEIATCASNSYRYVSINAGSGISYCIPAGTSQSPFIEVQGGIPEFGGGSFRIRTGAMGSVSDKLTVTQSGLILACGRMSSTLASNGNIQEWVGLTGTINNNTGWSLFCIANIYDILSMDIYVFTNVGSFQASKHEAVFGYTASTFSGIGFSSAFCIFKTGTLYNETMTICNLSGSNIQDQRIAIRVWGYGVSQNGTGGGNLLITSCLTRIY